MTLQVHRNGITSYHNKFANRMTQDVMFMIFSIEVGSLNFKLIYYILPDNLRYSINYNN